MQRQNYCSDWYFHFGDLKVDHWLREDPQRSDWEAVHLPHDWSISLPRSADNPSGPHGGFFTMGRGFYRKTILPSADWQGKKVLLEFEGAYMNTEIWLNENFVLRYPYGYTTFIADLTPFLKFGEENTLTVRVDNATQLNSRWYSGSGLYRPVWLIVSEPVHIAHWGIYITTPQVSAESALVRVQTTLHNESGQTASTFVRWRITAPDGQAAASSEAKTEVAAGSQALVSSDMQVKNPQRWSPESPSLYRLETEVIVDGKVVDTETTTFGIRSLEFSAEKGFLLNGEPVLLKGGCVHHDQGILGAASYTRSEERKVLIHKASGYNAIRCAHNPPAPAFLEACDRLGMLVMDEAFDCWRDGKNLYDYHINFDDWWQRDLDAMVLRDRNHPSVIIWSIGNEVKERDRQPEGERIARMLAERVRELDPTRPVTSAINGTWDGKSWEETDATFAALDVGGYNYKWQQYELDHERFPERMMIGTESFPLEAYQNWDAVKKHPYVLGDFVWTSLDYLGESGIGRMREIGNEAFLGKYPWHHANCGDLDLCGFKRPQSYYRDIVWDVGTRLYFAVHPPTDQNSEPSQWGWHDVWPNWNWEGYEGQPLKVDVYSACEEVELHLNERSLGRKPAGSAQQHIASFDVPYEAGTLKAVGYQDGEPAAELVLRTCGPASRVRLTVDNQQLHAKPDELAYVTVELLDGEGQVHPAMDRLVRFTITGPARLAAVGSGNPTSEEAYQSDRRTTFRGRCLAVVQSTGEPGEVILCAEADGLENGEIRLIFE